MKLRRNTVCLLLAALAPAAWAFDPFTGDWVKSDALDLRVMTWNVQDGICRTAVKSEALNSWCALARIVASLKPDVLILQEMGDNEGNGTGSGVDSVAQLKTTIHLFFHGGTDPFLGGSVGAYVRKYDPNYNLPFVFVSDSTDGFNRNVILSRFPFDDLNGDTKSKLNDMPFLSPHLYAPGGNGGIRGFQFAEINLPDRYYCGDLVIGNAHLKSGGNSSDLAARLTASQNVAYFIDHWYNGGGLGVPDPFLKILDNPPADVILDANTPVIIGGDWNEDELNNGRKGPTEWLTVAQNTGGVDGTDRDRSDSLYDASVNPLNGNRSTQSSSKLDYLAWQNSIADLRRSFVFNTSGMTTGQTPPELIGFTINPSLASGTASDHRPVIADFMVPLYCFDSDDVLDAPLGEVLDIELDPDQP